LRSRHHVEVTTVGEHPRFRFSLQAVEAQSKREWLELVRRTDDAGFDMIVTADHMGGCLSPLLPLATAAEVSDHLRLGVMVLNSDFHHPSLLARSATTLDLLSDGRLELGLGAGHAQPEYHRAGLAFDAAGVRVERLEEAVIVLRQLLDGETVTFAGTHYRLVEERCDPAPIQPSMPLLVGGAGRRVHRVAARHADAVGSTGVGRTLEDGQRHDPSGFRAGQVDDDVAAVRAAAAGRSSPLELQVLVQAVVVTDDAHGTAEQISRSRLPSLTADEVLSTPYLMVGSAATLVDRLIEQRERWGFSHYTVRQDALGQLEPVIAALAGR
jgi:probable F420-dependent oxidoreductase